MKEAVEMALHTLRKEGLYYHGCDGFSWNSVNWAVDGLLFNCLFELQFSQSCLLNAHAEQNVRVNFKGHKPPGKGSLSKGTGVQNALGHVCVEQN